MYLKIPLLFKKIKGQTVIKAHLIKQCQTGAVTCVWLILSKSKCFFHQCLFVQEQKKSSRKTLFESLNSFTPSIVVEQILLQLRRSRHRSMSQKRHHPQLIITILLLQKNVLNQRLLMWRPFLFIQKAWICSTNDKHWYFYSHDGV